MVNASPSRYCSADGGEKALALANQSVAYISVFVGVVSHLGRFASLTGSPARTGC
jgi:hypothetical protein